MKTKISKRSPHWKKNKNTHFESRWDNGTTELHIEKVPQISARKNVVRYDVVFSHATGGFHLIKSAKTKHEAMKLARETMRWLK